MKNFFKKLTIGSYIEALALILTLVSFIIYIANIASPGYFSGVGVSGIIGISIVSIIVLAVSEVLAFFNFKGISGKAVDYTVTLLRALVPILLILGMMLIVLNRAEGLAYLYGSNDEIKATLLDPATNNNVSGMLAITSAIFFGISGLIAIIGAFFSMPTKKANEEKAE